MQIDPVGPVLDLTQIRDRLCGVSCAVSMLNIIRKLLTFAPQQHERVELCIPISRPGGVIVTVNGETAVKEIHDCETFFDHFGTSFEVVKVRCDIQFYLFRSSFSSSPLTTIHYCRWRMTLPTPA